MSVEQPQTLEEMWEKYISMSHFDEGLPHETLDLMRSAFMFGAAGTFLMVKRGWAEPTDLEAEAVRFGRARVADIKARRNPQ